MQHKPLQTKTFTSWHQEPWVWFILSIFLVTFIWGAITLTVALTNRDTVVVDDYYKVGKIINEDLSRENRAKDLGISAIINIDDLTGEVLVQVTGNLDVQPETLMLRLYSPAFQSNDQTVMLRFTPNDDYIGNLGHSAEGRYYIQLETLDEQIPEQPYQTGWRLNQEIILTPGTPAMLLSDLQANNSH